MDHIDINTRLVQTESVQTEANGLKKLNAPSAAEA